jgi:hypothetical protein
MRINPIGYILRRVLVPSEVSDIIREGLQLGARQRAEEEQLAELWQRVHKASVTRDILERRREQLVSREVLTKRRYVLELRSTRVSEVTRS